MICVALDLHLVSESLDFNISIRNLSPLSIELCIQIGVLLFSFVINLPLFIDLGSEGLDEANVAINTTLVVLIHSALVFVESPKVLFHVQKLVLKGSVVPLSLAKLSCFLH